MKYVLPFLNISLLFLTFTACTLYREVPIEVLRPKEISIEGDTDIALLYRNFKYENDTLSHYFRDDYELKKDTRNDHLNIDSLLAAKALNTLEFWLSNEAVVENVHILPVNTLPRITGQHLTPLPKEVIQNIGTYSHSSRLLSLETLSYFFSGFSNLSDAGESSEVIMAGIWAIYDTRTGALIRHEPLVDTLFWRRMDEEGKKILLPSRIPALELATEEYVRNFAKKFTNSWETVNRIIIIPPVQEFNMAAEHAVAYEWEEALDLWMLYTPERFGRLTVSALFNVALSWEMQNDIDKALQFIGLAQEKARIYRNKDELRLVQNYQRILKDRKLDIERLNQAGND
jgi:hypothetical protein